VRGRPENIRRGRRAGAVGPARVARRGPARGERGRGAVGRGHGPGAVRPDPGLGARLGRAGAAQGARRVRRRAAVRVRPRPPAVRSRPNGQHPRQRVQRVFRDRTHRRAG